MSLRPNPVEGAIVWLRPGLKSLIERTALPQAGAFE